MSEHVTSFEARVLKLQQQIQFSFSIFNSAASELEGLCQEYSRVTGRGIPAVLLSRPTQHHVHQLQGAFQPRSLDGPWNSVQDGSFQGTTALSNAAAHPEELVCQPAEGRNGQGGQEHAVAPNINLLQRQVVGAQEPLPATRDQPSLPQQLRNAASQPHPRKPGAINHLDNEPSSARDAVTDGDAAASAAKQHAAAAHAAGTCQQDAGQCQQACAQQDAADLQQPTQQHTANLDTDAVSDSVTASGNLTDSDSASDAGVEEESDELQLAEPQLPIFGAVEMKPAKAAELGVDVAAPEETHTGMLRVPKPGSTSGFGTAGVFINDPVSLAATENGQLAPNNDIPLELEDDTSFIKHQQDQLAWVLTALSHARRCLGWTHIDAEDAEHEQQPAAEQNQDGSIDMGRESSSPEQDLQLGEESGSEAADVGDARRRRRRKQSKVTRRLSAVDHALDFASDSETGQQQGQAAPSAFTDLLQSFSNLHTAAAAGAAAARETASAAKAEHAATAPPVFCSADMQKGFAKMHELVQEDVERLAREWEQHELPNMQKVAADVWMRVHTEVSTWELNVFKAKSTLEAGIREMVMSNADNVAGYMAARVGRSEALRGWVGMYEGAKYVLSIAQLSEAPEPVQQQPDVDEAGAAATRRTPLSHAAAHDTSPAAAAAGEDIGPQAPSEASEEAGSGSSTGVAGDSTDDSSSDDFIDDSMLPKPVAPAGSTAGGSGQQRPATPADASAGDAHMADAQSSESGAAAASRAWNVPHLAPGNTQILVGGRRLKQQQHRSQQQPEQPQQSWQPLTEQECQQQVSEQQQGSNQHVEPGGMVVEDADVEQSMPEPHQLSAAANSDALAAEPAPKTQQVLNSVPATASEAGAAAAPCEAGAKLFQPATSHPVQAGPQVATPAGEQLPAVHVTLAYPDLQAATAVTVADATAVHVTIAAAEGQQAADPLQAASASVHSKSADIVEQQPANVATADAETSPVGVQGAHASGQSAADQQTQADAPAEKMQKDVVSREHKDAEHAVGPVDPTVAACEHNAASVSRLGAAEQQAVPVSEGAADPERRAQEADEFMQGIEEDDDIELVIFPRTQRHSSSDNSQLSAEGAAQNAAVVVKTEDKLQQEQELPAPAVDLDALEMSDVLSEASSDEVAAPACDYEYPDTVTKGNTVHDDLQLEQPCELLQAVSGGEHVTWSNMLLVQRTTVQPRWHSWRQAAAVLDVDEQAGFATLKNYKGRNSRVPLSSVRPLPPQSLYSLVPPDALADTSSIAAWANSSTGLLHLSRALRPGILLEFRQQQSHSWSPAVILHSRMIRPALSQSMIEVLQQRSTAAAEDTTLAAAGQLPKTPVAAAADGINTAGLVAAGEWLGSLGQQKGPTSREEAKQYAPPDQDNVVLVLLMLDSTSNAEVCHVTWGDLLESSPRLRYMLHWTTKHAEDEAASGSSEPVGATPKSDTRSCSTAVSHADDGNSLLQGRWQRLMKFTCLPVHRWAKQQMEKQHKSWLRSIGWPRRGGHRRVAGDLLSEEQLRMIARKLARRPTSVAAAPALKVAAGVGSNASKLGRKVQRRHDIALRVRIGDDAGPPTIKADAPKPQRPKRKHCQVVKDESDSEAPQSKQVKRQRTRGGSAAKSQQQFSEDEELSMDALEASPPPRSRRPLRRRLTTAKQSAAAANSDSSFSAASSAADSDESVDSEALSSSDISGIDPEYDVDEDDDKVVMQDGMGVLYDHEPAGPLNPRLPRCWYLPGQAADKQVIKPHQLSGLRFMFDSLVKEHSSGAMERRQQEKKRKNKNQQNSRKKGRLQKADASVDSDFESAREGDEDDGDALQDSEGSESAGEHSEADDAGGCILAHSMGLGKSFQTIALLWVFFQRSRGRALLVVPTNVVANWVDEFKTWLPSKADQDYKASHLRPHKVFMATKGGMELAKQVDKWMRYQGSVLVLSYDMYMRAVKTAEDLLQDSRLQSHSPAVSVDAADDDELDDDDEEQDEGLVIGRRKTPASMKERVRKALLQGASVVVADEAHQMKNAKTQKCIWMRQVSTMRRLALTGYPLQNKLDEYYQMILWVQPEELFMEHQEFRGKFVVPITEGQQPGATPAMRRKMAKQLSVLHDYTASFIQRAGPEVLLRDLPPKREYVIALAPTATQARLLGHFLDCIQNRSLFRDYRMMRKILDTRDHGYADLVQAAEAARLGSAAELHDADSRDGDEQLLVQAVGQSNAAPNAVPLQVLEALLQEYPQHQQLMRQQQEGETAAAARQPDTDATGEQGLLPKEVFIRQLIKRACVEIGEKVVIFSESLVVLDSLEQLMQEEFGYKLDRHYLRLQGSTDAQERRRLIRKFNHKQQVKVFLLSTLAGSVGINLVAARRLVLYDLPWNPVHNRQAVSRVWRYGQTRACFLYHLMYSGTVEQHMYEQTLAKLELFELVVERQSRRAAVDEQLKSRAYMLQPVSRLDETQLAERVQAVLTPAAAASAAQFEASGAATAAAAEVDEVLLRILQDSATVDSLALTDLKNHEEMLQDDPTAKLNAEEKRRAVAAYERKRRQSTLYSSAAASQYGATQAPLGADGLTDRTRRLERRRQRRLEDLYGKDFIDLEAEQLSD